MKTAKPNRQSERCKALQALKRAILEGATPHYGHLIAEAVRTGASDEEIDLIAHEAVQELFACAEQLVTPRVLDHFCAAAHFRH